ncbi:hypothetical protein WJX84_009220 [Apatococcus fuscideae]|uniref:Nucleoprotein TPR n=1 Tax=Apatococcus fuscideae TaxID=2026836 RepID=A0AAW1TKR6_9CHLO
MDQAELLSRISLLEEELSDAKARAEAAEVNANHAGQKMEERYNLLAEEKGSEAAANKKLALELESAEQATSEGKQESIKLRMDLMERDKAMQQQNAEVQMLGQQLRALDRSCGHHQAEIVELQTQLQMSRERNIELMRRQAELESQVFEAKSREARANALHLQLEGQVATEKANVHFLNGQLESQLGTLRADRDSASAQAAQVSQQLTESQDELRSTKQLHASLRARVDQYAKKIQDLELVLKEERDSSALTQETLEGQIDKEQKLAALHKHIADERTSKATELDGIVQQFKQHLKDAGDRYKDASAKEQAEREELMRQLEQERVNKQRILAEFQAGNSLGPAPIPSGSPSANGGGPAAGHINGFGTPTELVKKNADLREKLRIERSKTAQLDLSMEQATNILDARSAMLEQQRIDAEQRQDDFDRQTVQLKDAVDEKRELLQRVTLLRREAKDADTASRMKEQQVQDLGHQLQILLDENQRLKQGRQPRAPQAPPDMMDSSAVIDHRLLPFKDIKELQANNAALLSAVRQLSEEQETTREAVREEVEAEKNQHVEELRKQLALLRQTRQAEQEVQDQLMRQRDTYRHLLITAAGDADSAQASARQVGLLPDAPANGSLVIPDKGPQAGNISEQMQQVASELEKVRVDARENASLYQNDIAEARSSAVRAQGDAARARAEADFQAGHAKQLEEQLEDMRKHLSTVLSNNARHQGLLSSSQAKQSEAAAEAEAARASKEVLQRQVQVAEAELQHLKAAYTRDTALLDEANRQRLDVSAKLTAFEMMREEREKDAAKQQRQSAERCAALQAEVDELHSQLGSLRFSNKSAHETLETKCAEAQSRVKTLEEDCRRARDAQSSAEQRAAAADARQDMLSKAVQKAESRATLLEQRARTSSSAQAGDARLPDASAPISTNEKVQQLQFRIRQLEEQLGSAQEAVAGASSTSKTFQSIAESNEAAMEELQARHQEYKQTAEKQLQSSESSLKEIQTQLQSMQNQLTASREAKSEAEHKAEQLVTQAMTDMGRHRDNALSLVKDKQQLVFRNEHLRQDIGVLRKQIQASQENYQREVVEHSNTIKRSDALKADRNGLQESKERVEAALTQAQAEKNQAEQQLQETQSRAQLEAGKLQDQMRDLKMQNQRLHEELDRAAGQSATAAADAAGDDRLGVIRYLREQNEVAEAKLALTEAEQKRWQQQASVANRNARHLQAQLDSMRQQSGNAPQQAGQHEALSRALEQNQVLTESNKALRSASNNLEQQLAKLRAQRDSAQADLNPLKQKVRELEAAQGSHEEELERAHADTTRWHERVIQLTTRHKSVDKQEYDRVSQLLKDTQAEMATAKAAAEEQAQGHAGKSAGMELQLRKAQKTITDLRAQASATGSDYKKQYMERMRMSDRQRSELRDQLADCNTLMDGQKAQIAEMVANIEAQKAIIAERDTAIQDHRQQISTLQENEASIQQALAKLKDLLTASVVKLQVVTADKTQISQRLEVLTGRWNAACERHPDLDSSQQEEDGQQLQQPDPASQNENAAEVMPNQLPSSIAADPVEPRQTEDSMPADVPAQARSEPILSALESLLPTGLSTAPSGSLSLAEAQAQEAPAAEGPAGLSAGQALEDMRARALGTVEQMVAAAPDETAAAEAEAFLAQLPESQPEPSASQAHGLTDQLEMAAPSLARTDETDENQSNGKRMGEPLEPQDEPGAKRSRQQDTDAPVLQPAPVQPQLTAVSSTGPFTEASSPMDAENPFQDVAELIQPNPTADDSQFEAPEQPEEALMPMPAPEDWEEEPIMTIPEDGDELEEGEALEIADRISEEDDAEPMPMSPPVAAADENNGVPPGVTGLDSPSPPSAAPGVEEDAQDSELPGEAISATASQTPAPAADAPAPASSETPPVSLEQQETARGKRVPIVWNLKGKQPPK